MASPSRAEVETQWKNAVKILKETKLYGKTNTQNMINMVGSAVESVESDYAQGIVDSLMSARSGLSNILSQAQSLQLSHLQSYCKHIVQSDETNDPQVMLARLYRYMNENSLSVNSRGFTFGTPTASGVNIGNSQIVRLTVDRYGYNLENQHADAKRAICIADQNNGVSIHEEVFEFRGQNASFDELDWAGSGLRKNIAALSARQSLLLNPSFSAYASSAGVLTDVSNWTITSSDTWADFAISTSGFRTVPGESTSYALRIDGGTARSIQQKLSLRGTQLDPNVPYMLQVAYKRIDSTVSGTLTIELGSISSAVSVGAAAGTNWHVARIPASPTKFNWYDNFNENDLDVEITWNGNGATSDILIDDILLVPFSEFDGSWYAILPKDDISSYTPFLRDDEFNWSDTETGAVLQEWIFRGFGGYVPSNTSGGETWTDP